MEPPPREGDRTLVVEVPTGFGTEAIGSDWCRHLPHWRPLMSDLRSKMIRLAASMPKGSSERKALLNVLAASKEEEDQVLGGMLWLSGMEWRFTPQPEDAAGGPVDSGVLASYLKWGGGGVASVLRQLNQKGLVGALNVRGRKNRWYLTTKGLSVAQRLPK